MESRQARALDLERQLQRAQQQSKQHQNDQAVNRLRVPLCEVLADMILTHPAQALDYDVDNRLWKHCFYSRIVPQRQGIAKAHKKLQQQQQSSSSSVQLYQQQQQTVQHLEQALHQFLAEAVTLYRYLVNHLQAKLLGQSATFSQSQASSASSSQTLSQSQDDDDEPSPNDQQEQEELTPLSPTTCTDGLVEWIHQLHIRLGDLFRYSLQLSQAQHAYETATTLGPGHGHAWNQLAVVSQVNTTNTNTNTTANTTTTKGHPTTATQHSSASALYWYARALLAQTVPFATARSNLTRLFQDNQEWLQQHGATATTSTTTTWSQRSAPPSNNSNNKQVMTTRLFLAEFVDLHRLFFVAKESTTLYKTMERVLQDRLARLLQVSAFGDALLCKLICIQAFSEHIVSSTTATSSSPTTTPAKATIQPHRKSLTVFGWAARTATFQFATQMADKVLATALQKQKQQSSKPSVRLLLPLVLVTDHVVASPLGSSRGSNKNSSSSKAQQRHDQAAVDFWMRMVQVWNHVSQHLAHNHDVEEEQAATPKEYDQWIGFAPFAAFLPLEHESGFVSKDKAIQFLTTTTTTNKPASKSLSSQPTTNPHACLIRRMLTVAQRVAQTNPHITCTWRTEEDAGMGSRGPHWMWEWHDEPPTSQSPDREPEQDQMAMMIMEEEENDNPGAVPSPPTTLDVLVAPSTKPPPPQRQPPAPDEPVLVYQAARDEGSPALLVPGALLATTTTTTTIAAQTVSATKPSSRSDATRTLPEDPMMVEMDHILTVRDDSEAHDDQDIVPAVAPAASTVAPSHQQSTPTPPTLPPPGFGPPPGFAGGAAAAPTSVTTTTTGLPSNPFPAANPGWMWNNGALAQPPPQQSIAAQHSMTTVGQVMGTVPLPPTHNPFAVGPTMTTTTTTGMPWNTGPPTAVGGPLWVQPTMGTADGTSSSSPSLLDSGLLQSLWMDEASSSSSARVPPKTTTTQNPFALS